MVASASVVLLTVLLQQASAFTVPAVHNRMQSSRRCTSPAMIRPQGNSNPNFDPSKIDPEKLQKTERRQIIVLGVVGAVAGLVYIGKKDQIGQAPGLAEAQVTAA